MPRTDRSVTILTGMIIAALYVIMLVGFSRESYMRRDAAARTDFSADLAAADDGTRRLCRPDRPFCPTPLPGAGDPQGCQASIEVVRMVIGGRLAPLTLDGIRRVLRQPAP